MYTVRESEETSVPCTATSSTSEEDPLKKSSLPKLFTSMSLAALITAGSLPLMAQDQPAMSCSPNMKMEKTETKKTTTKKTQKAKTTKAKQKTGAAPATGADKK